jgi:hypothetical protein
MPTNRKISIGLITLFVAVLAIVTRVVKKLERLEKA